MYKVWFKIFTPAIILAMLISLFPVTTHPVQASTNGVVISQVYGGGGNSGGLYTYDFIELFNGGTEAVSLNGMSVQYASATGTGNFGGSSSQITELPDVTLAPGQYFLIQEAPGSTVIADLPTPDHTDSTVISIASGAGKVALVNSTTGLGCNGGSTPCTAEKLALIIDLVGWGNANFYEGTAAAPATANNTAVIRNGAGCTDTDQNAADFTAATPTPRNTATTLNACAVVDPAPEVTSTNPANAATDVAVDANLTVTFSEPVNVADGWFSLSCSVSGSHTATVSGGPTEFVLDPETNFTNDEYCTLTIVASKVTDQDTTDPLDAMINDYSATFTIASVVVDSAPVVSTTVPANSAVDVALDANVSVAFSEAVNVVDGWYNLSCATSGAHTAVVSGGPTEFTLNPDTDFVNSEVCTLTVTAANVTDQDTNDPPDAMASDYVTSFTTVPEVVVDNAPAVSAVVPANGATDVAVGANLTVTFSEAVNVSGSWYNLSCATSGTHTATVTGGSTEFTLNPDTDFTAGETCTLTVYAANVADLDANDPPDAMAADFTSTFTVYDICTATYTPAYTIQGNGETSPISGETVTTKGVVVADYEYTGTSTSYLRGFFIQDLTGDGDATTSDGLFVYNPGRDNVSLGDVVAVTGKISEYSNQTQITANSASAITICGTGTVAPVDVTFPVASATFLEQYEGMLVRLPQTMYVTEIYQLGRYGQVTLSVNAKLDQPTNVVAPGDPAKALQAQNDLSKIYLDDGTNVQNPDPIVFGRNGLPLSASNTLRGGDTATGIVGIMNYYASAYRVRPINVMGGTVNFVAANERPTTPANPGGELKVVSMNLLNYFNTFDGYDDLVDNCTLGVGGAATDCRGADDQAEFDRQWVKTVAAILAIDPDVLAVNEIENDGYGTDSAIAHLVDQLNAVTAAGTYAFVDADTATGQVNALGTDAIKVGMIYKPAKVTLMGAAALNSEAFVNGGDTTARSRPALAATFSQVSDGEIFTAVANHLKSKGSACDAADAGDGQGNCNIVRTNAVIALAAWLATDPTGSGDPDVLIMGDLNSYAMEDPVTTLEGLGYTNLVKTFVGTGAYSYVYDGQWGYLDHALANASMLKQVAGVVEYHINSDEPSVLDYNTNYKSTDQLTTLYAADQYRVSDHDPIIVGLNLTPSNSAPSVDAGGPYEGVEGSTITVTATGTDPDGDVLTYAWDLDNDGTYETAGESATITLVDGPATLTVHVMATEPGGLTASDEATVMITNADPVVKPVAIYPGLVIPVNKQIQTCADFTDPGTLDTHTAVYTWGDGSSSDGEVHGACARGAHVYTAAGFYTITVTVIDKDGGTGQAVSQQLVVYDPRGGEVYAAGKIYSQAGAFKLDPTLEGKAHFAFMAKYMRSKPIPIGVITFDVKMGWTRMNFTSYDIDWMVVSPDHQSVVLTGQGRINGRGRYQYMVWAEDGDEDTLRIKIWYVTRDGSEVVVYDNDTLQAIQSGRIDIRKW